MITNKIHECVASIVEVGGNYSNLVAIMSPRTKASLQRENEGVSINYPGRLPRDPYPHEQTGGQAITMLMTDFGQVAIAADPSIPDGDVIVMDAERYNRQKHE